MRNFILITILLLSIKIKSQTSSNFSITTNPATCSSCCDGNALVSALSGSCNPYSVQWLDSSGYVSGSLSLTNCCAGNSYTVNISSSCGNEVFYCNINYPITTNSQNILINHQIFVYPNPNNGCFDVKINDEMVANICILQIVNKLGEIIKKIPLQCNTHIDLEGEGVDLYFYRILENDKIIKMDKLFILK